MMLMISGATVSVDDAALFAGHHLLTIVHRTIDTRSFVGLFVSFGGLYDVGDSNKHRNGGVRVP